MKLIDTSARVATIAARMESHLNDVFKPAAQRYQDLRAELDQVMAELKTIAATGNIENDPPQPAS